MEIEGRFDSDDNNVLVLFVGQVKTLLPLKKVLSNDKEVCVMSFISVFLMQIAFI